MASGTIQSAPCAYIIPPHGRALIVIGIPAFRQTALEMVQAMGGIVVWTASSKYLIGSLEVLHGADGERIQCG